MKKKYLGMSKVKGEKNIEELLVRIAQKHPIELEERINTLDRPLIIECACPGWQSKNWAPPRAYPVHKPPGYKEGGIRYPAVPCTIEDQADILIEAVKLGAAALHIHPRDPSDCIAINDAKLIKQVYDRVFQKTDAITLQHTWERTEDNEITYVGSHGKELLELGKGNRYCQGAVVLWPPADAYPPEYTKAVQEGVQFLEENNIKPIHKLRNYYGVRQLKRILIDTQVMKTKPYVLVHDMGHPFGWPMDMDPWMPVDMIISLVQTKQRLGEGHILGVYSGGRNWLPITMTAILAGVDLIRVGIEDCYWMYPHKDEVIQNNNDTVKKIVKFCESIGRKVAGVDEARKILDIKKPE